MKTHRTRRLSSLVVALMCLAAPARAYDPISDEVLARAREEAPVLDEGVVEWTWLGIAGLRLRTKDAVILVDPYLTRAGLADIIFRTVSPNESLLEELLPEADAILIGHSHYDHLADAPSIARRTGALVLGSRTTCYLSRALGAPHCLTPKEHRPLPVAGGVRATRIPARHGNLGVLALFGGERSIRRQPKGRIHPLFDMPHGGPQAWVLDVERMNAAPLRVFVHTSAGLDPPTEDTLEDLEADIAFVSASLAHDEDRWPERISLAVKRGGTLVLTHYESLWATLADDAPLNAGTPDLDALVRGVKEARPDLNVVVPKAFVRHLADAPKAP